MIKPSIGRVVWFYARAEQAQPQAALVTYVHGDECVNLVTFSTSGIPEGKTSVRLFQGEGERPNANFCEWMPYQIGQAKKHEEAK